MFLKISETNIEFVGKGLSLLDPKVMDELKLRDGDILELTNHEKSVYVRVLHSLPSDYGRQVIRIDGYTRSKLDSGLDDHINLKKIQKFDLAIEIILNPSEELQYYGFEDYLHELLNDRVVSLNDIIPLNLMGKRITFSVESLKPNYNPLIITGTTKFSIGKIRQNIVFDNQRINYEDLGGMKEAIQKTRELIELPIRYPELFNKIGIEPPKGVLLYGPPGTGKTLLAKAVANETNANFYSISGPEVVSKYYGESEERLRNTFKEAHKNSPSIVFIDEIDSIAPKREDVSGDVEKRMVSQLLTLMDGLNTRGKVVVIGATNRPNAIDIALRRPGRFDREIEIGIPDEAGRFSILQIHTRGMPINIDVDLYRISKITHGFVGADLASLVKEAAMCSLREVLQEVTLDKSPIPLKVLDKINVTGSHFNEAFKNVFPSAIREFQVQKPSTKWNQIGGMDHIKEEVMEVTLWPIRFPELYDLAGIRPPKGVLLYGPPGTGKTLLAKAVASTSEINFISMKGSEITSKWTGESEKAIHEIFKKAKQSSPCIIFFDELDAITPRRGSNLTGPGVTERIISQMLSEMDGLESLDGVIVIGATNRIDVIDEALLRPGRFDRLIHVPIPDEESRKSIIEIYLEKKPLEETSLSVQKIVDLTEGFTGAQIEGIINLASTIAIKEFLKNHHLFLFKDDIDKELVIQNLKEFKINLNHFILAKKKLDVKLGNEYIK